MARSDAIIQLRDLISDRRVAMLTTAEPSGELHSRPLTLNEVDDDARLVFLVDAEVDWVVGIGAGESVNVGFADDGDQLWVSVAGEAHLENDRATIHRLWTPAAEAFFPDGPESPNVRILAVTATTVEYWDAPSGRVQRLVVMASAILGDRTASVGESGKIDLT